MLVAMSEKAAELDVAVRCPGCGYDVRFAADSRCSECGRVFDRQRLERTWWPWAHRRELGRVRAFFKTMIAVMFMPFRARDQVFGVLTLGDAWRFWWWCVMAAMPVWVFAAMVAKPPFGSIIECWLTSPMLFLTRWQSSDFWFERPWVVAFSSPGVLVVALWAGARATAMMWRAGFQSSTLAEAASKESAAALGVYQTAHMVIWSYLLVSVPVAAVAGYDPEKSMTVPVVIFSTVVTIYGWSAFSVARVFVLTTATRWSADGARQRWRGVLGVAYVVGVALLVMPVATVALYWLCGAVRLMIGVGMAIW